MAMFKLLFFMALAFLAAVAIFIGGVMMLSSLQSGAVTISYTDAGKAVTETVTRAADSTRYWRLFATIGLLPVLLGAGILWFSTRKLRGQ